MSNSYEKQQWIAYYSGRILNLWSKLESPFEIDPGYCATVENRLDEFFDDPLRKNWIETTYRQEAIETVSC